MVWVFRYHSHTQRIIHGVPFCLLLGLAAWTVEFGWATDAVAGLLVLVSFGWLTFANFAINHAISRSGTTRIGSFDFSQNSKPTAIERALMRLIGIASVVSGLTAASVLVYNIKRGGFGTTLVFGGIGLFLVAALTYGILTFAVIVLSGFRIRPARG